jgi:protocatechuate 3,4-dioxygenase beta subunit
MIFTKHWKFEWWLPVIAVLIFCAPVRAQLSEGGVPPSFTHEKLPARARQASLVAPPVRVVLPVGFDVEQLKAQDAANEAMGMPLNMARDIPVDLTASNSGEWSTLSGGQRIWQLTVEAPGALATMIYYDELRLPLGGRLFIYNPQHTKILGAYTAASNPAGGKFATELLEGDVFTLEYVAPDSGEAKTELPRIRIEAVAYAYNHITLYPEVRQESYGDALDCQVNTACSEGSSRRDQIKGVVRISFRKTGGGSTSWCSGAILNNLRQDFAPYLLTAFHCVDESDSAALLQTVVYFHYEYANCGDNKDNASEPTRRTLSGAQLLAATPQSGGSDGALLRLTQNIPPDYNAYYNGWSAYGVTPTSGVGIHHPRGDVKKISTFTYPARSGTFSSSSNTGATGAHWLVEYDATDNGYSRTESGSSGSSLFDQQGKIVGTLSGSNSVSYPCDGSNGNTAGTAWYGKLSYHWDAHSGDSAKYHMKTYLDPDGSGLLTVAGSYYVAAYTVTFTVTDAQGAPIPDAVATLNGIANAAGDYVFSNLAAGVYAYEVAKSGYITASGSLTVNSGNLSKEITLQPTPPPAYTVTFAVTDAQGAPIPDAVATLNGVANAAGDYVFSNVAAGVYAYEVAKSGYITASGSLTVSSGNLAKEVTLQPTPPPAYTVTFAVTDAQGAPIPDAVATLNGVANAAGEYVFSNLAAGVYAYEVTKSGYITASGSLTVSSGNLAKEVTLQPLPPPAYTVTFTVTDAQGAPIPDAVATLNGVANAAGDYVFSNVAAGVYAYEVTKSGYIAASGSLTVSGGNLAKEVTLQPTPPPAYTVTFAVTNAQGAPIPDAVATLNGVANAAGDYVFSNVAAGVYAYEVTKSGYIAASGSLTVSSGNLAKEVTLQPTPPPAYTVTFAVTNAQGAPISDAIATLNGIANAAGDYVFSNVAAGVYAYSVTTSGYIPASGSLTVSGSNLTKEVTLQPTPPPAYTVTFAVTDAQGAPISDAVATLNGIANAAGNYIFSNLAAGVYSYVIAKSGYATVSDSLTVNNGNLFVNEVLYIYSGIIRNSRHSEATLSIKLFPNPTVDGTLHVSLGEEMSSVGVEVYTLAGELCLSQTFSAASFSIDISKCPEGVLFVKFFGGGRYAVKAAVKLKN